MLKRLGRSRAVQNAVGFLVAGWFKLVERTTRCERCGRPAQGDSDRCYGCAPVVDDATLDMKGP